LRNHLNHIPQVCVLLLEFTDDLVLDTFIDHSLVLNLLSTFSIPQSRQGLFVVHERG
jgi:hypothetical protein